MREKKDDKFLLLIKDFIKSLAFSLVLVIIITQFLARPVRVEGLSMYPTLDNHEAGFSNILGVKMSEIQRFDIVVVYLKEQNKYIVKRVIGLPGETIEFRNDILYVNNEPVEEPYLDNDYANDWKRENDRKFTDDLPARTIPEGQYFLMGDNRQKSSDSRHYGAFNKGDIKSKDVFVFLPFTKIRHVGR